MKKPKMRLLLVLVAGIFVIAAPTVSQAVTITSIKVSFGTTTFCDTTQAGCTLTVWDLGGGKTVGVGGNNALVLTQNQSGVSGSIGGFNFDTSEIALGVIPTGPVPAFTGSATIGIGINGNTTANSVVFTDNGTILNLPQGLDPTGIGADTHQESVDWTLPAVNTLGGIKIWLGYADTSHNASCSDGDTDCLPGNGTANSPWGAAQLGSNFLGGTAGPSGCIKPGTTACFDAGAIRIEAVAAPEPSPLLLFGIGLIAVSLVIQKKAKGIRS
jgi:hypothetical protein